MSLFDGIDGSQDAINRTAQSLGVFARILVFILRPRVLIPAAIVFLFIGIAQHVHDALLIPIILALLIWALILRLRGQ
jgi:hypothetical protein